MSQGNNKKSVTHFINILDHDSEFLIALLNRAIADKALFRNNTLPKSLEGKTLVMYFEKASLRTRMSFETAMTNLGGHGIYMTNEEIGLGKREPVKDVARVISGMVDGFIARTFSHEAVCEMAKYASIPIVNALTDYSHPCQAMADVMTIQEEFGHLEGLKLTYIGDGNNVARSLACACGRFKMEFAIAAPKGFELEDEFIDSLKNQMPDMKITTTNDPKEAIANADAVYTDTWVSMGQEAEKQERIKKFEGYQITTELMSLAKPKAIFLHCLPAYRGFEVTDEVMESEQSRVFQEAENRLHFQRTLLAQLMEG